MKPIFSTRSGFSLLECLFAMIIVMFLALGTIGAIIFARQSMELDKQRLVAINVARDYMEQAHAHINVSNAVVRLVDFDTPTSTPDALANVEVEYFPIDSNTDGSIDWDNPAILPDAVRPYFCRVTISWVPPGSWSRMPQFVRMGSVVRRSL